MTTKLAHLFLAASTTSMLLACGSEAPFEDFEVSEQARTEPAQRTPCTSSKPLRNAYFGDLHVHTSLSNDGWSFGVRATPEDAYRYAFDAGNITLPVNRGDQANTRQVSIDRPLDFMAVTDHAEFLGEQTLCLDPNSEVADAQFYQAFTEGEGRNRGLLAKIFSPAPTRDKEVCGKDGQRCAQASQIPWQQTIDAAEHWNDNSGDCERTAFIAFEYSSHRLGSNLHRNVIFRNTVVPKRPISYLDANR